MQSLDVTLLRAVYASHMPAAWTHFVVAVTFLGSGWMLLGLLPLLFMRRFRGRALVLLAALTALSGVVAATKAVTCRVRPCHAVAWARALDWAPPTDFSFPSGHAAGSFAFASFVMALHRRAGAWLFVLASAIALSRVALGVHYPTDVVAGAVLGVSFGWAAARIGQPRTRGSSNEEDTAEVLAPVGGLADADPEPCRK